MNPGDYRIPATDLAYSPKEPSDKEEVLEAPNYGFTLESTGKGSANRLERTEKMADKIALTNAELAYIKRLLGSSELDSDEVQTGFSIEGGEHANGLLLQLAAKASLTLEAQLDEYCMRFPLRLNEDELHGIQLQLAPPTIYECGPVLRAWRLPLEEPLALLSHDGRETALSVHELSAHGLLVDTGAKKAPKRLHLQLPLPGESPLKFDALQVRNTPGGLTVYEVEYHSKDAERIRSYLYEQHQRLHPELQQELPVKIAS